MIAMNEIAMWIEHLLCEENRKTEEVVPGVPIVRSNTPRPSSFDAMISSTGYLQKSQHGNPIEFETLEIEKGELPHGFPAKAPSAPPLPEELEDGVDAIEGG